MIYRHSSSVGLTLTLSPSLYHKSLLLIYRRDNLNLYYPGKPVAKLPFYVFGLVIDDITIHFLA
jgi:hypothetical protein